MLPSIKIASNTLQENDSLAILVKEPKNIPANILSTEEKKFVEKEFNEKRNTIIINQYHRLVIIFRLEEKKKDDSDSKPPAAIAIPTLLETCRKAGEQVATVIN